MTHGRDPEGIVTEARFFHPPRDGRHPLTNQHLARRCMGRKKSILRNPLETADQVSPRP